MLVKPTTKYNINTIFFGDDLVTVSDYIYE